MKVQKIKFHYICDLRPPCRDIDNLCFSILSMFGWNHLQVKSLFPINCTVIFKISNQNSSDKLLFEEGKNHKKHQLHDSFKFYYPTLSDIYTQQNLIQVLCDIFYFTGSRYQFIRYSYVHLRVSSCSPDVLWCYLVLYDVIWCYLMLADAIWCYLMLVENSNIFLSLP